MELTVADIFNLTGYTLTVHAAFSALVGLIFGGYAIYALARARGSRAGVVFALFATSVSIWLVGFGFVYASRTPSQALWLIKLSYVGVTFIPALGLIFALVVVGGAAHLRRSVLTALVLSTVFLAATFSTDAVIGGVYEHWWGYYPRLGALGVLFVLYLVSVFMYILRLFLAARRSGPSERARRRHQGLLSAFLIAPLGALDFLGTFGVPLYPIGYVTSALSLFLIAFVNSRYGFLDITPELAAGQILETMHGAVIVVDIEGKIRVVNRVAEEMLGRARSDLHGTSLAALIDLPAELRVSNAGGMPVTGWEMGWRVRSGRSSDVSISASALRDKQGFLVGVVYVASDITERQRAEEALRESEQRFRATLKSMTDLVFVLDKEDRFVDYHAPSSEALYLPPALFLGKAFRDVLPRAVAERVERAIGVIKSGGPVQRLDYELEMHAQRTWWSAAVCPRWDSAGGYDGATIVTRDMTERRSMEDRLHQSEKLTAIGQLAGGIAHDFNNQLTGILGYADMLVARLEEGQLRRYAHNILVSARRAADLTQQLLAFSRKGRYLSMPVDIHRLLAEVVAILERSIDKRIRISQVLRASPALTLGDPTQLQNALLNIALNARDAMPQGGDLTFETDVATLDEGSWQGSPCEIASGPYLRICITDTGGGMTEEAKKHLFEPFFTTKRPGEGTGMGLASTYGTVRNHGGAINVDSVAGRGTAVHIWLPLALGATVTEETAPGTVTARSRARILLVDDEPAIREMAAEMLRGAGYSVTTCADGREAVEYYRGSWRQIDLVILDMVMPRMDGRDAFMAMRRTNPQIRALLSSGHSLDGIAQSVLDEGVTAFIGKPYLQAELLRKVFEALTLESA